MRPLGNLLIGIAVFRTALGAWVLVALTLGVSGAQWMCLGAFGLAQASDHVDGWTARRFSTPCTVGYLQDSIADKLFHLGCLLGLATPFPMLGVLIWGVLIRELVLMGTRIVAVDLKRDLAEKKPLSVGYAAALRVGILAFLLVPFIEAKGARLVVLGGGYGLVALAIVVGLTGLMGTLSRPTTIARQL